MRVTRDPGPRSSLGVPQIALQPIGLVGIGRDHPAEEDVLAALPGVLEQPLTQIDVVASDLLVDAAALAHGLQEVHAGQTRRDGARDVGFRQPHRCLNTRSRRKVGEKGRLGRVELKLLKPGTPVSSQLGPIIACKYLKSKG